MAEPYITPSAKMLGATAKSAFANPAFENAVIETTSQIVREWAATTADQQTLREQLWLKHQGLEDIINIMTGYMVASDNEETLDAAPENPV
jgi:hypothetical protein